MNLVQLIPIGESLIPALKTIVENNVSNVVEKAALIGFLDLCKSVADAYMSTLPVAKIE